jgi:hypothetical protein
MKFKKIQPKDIGKVSVTTDYPWRLLSHLTDDLARTFGVNTPPELASAIRYKDARRYIGWSSVNDLQSINRDGCTFSEALVTNQRSALLKKFPLNIVDIDRSQAAIDKFLAVETRLSALDFRAIYVKHPEFVNHLRTFISKVLGNPQNNFKDMFWNARFGPGATLGITKGMTSNFYKFKDLPYSCTQAAMPISLALIKSDERWRWAVEKQLHLCRKSSYEDLFEMVDGNKVTTVPKTALIDRTIAIEPLMNVMLQLGIHEFLSPRLKRFCNIDLQDQGRNREFATRLSHATIDLSSASDSISNTLVGMLFPPVWREVLRSLRSPEGILPNGEKIKYKKISSMGNGYTFVLETLIFAAVVSFVVGEKQLRESCALYGDDIIVPCEHVDQVIGYLEVLGFIINKDKSFTNGLIRESCGVEYFNGKNIRSVYIKKQPTHVTHLFNDYNRLKRFFKTHAGSCTHCTSLDYIFSLIPKELRLYGPILEDKYLDYSSYIHSEVPKSGSPGSKYQDVYKFRSFINRSSKIRIGKEMTRSSFEFFTLMHDLKNCESDTGCRFEVTRRHSSNFEIKTSRSAVWNVDYDINNALTLK